MTDTPIFGKRISADRVSSARHRTPMGSTPAPTKTRPQATTQAPAVPSPTDTGNLPQKSEAWRLAGDLVAFIGALLAFLTVIMWPDDPANLSEFNGAIYVPASLAHLLTFDLPAATTIRASIGTTTVIEAGGTVAAMALLGIVAIVRRRWVLAGLVCAFFLFPWGTVGYRIPMAPAIVCAMAILLFFRIYSYSKRALLAMAAAIAFAGWIIVPLLLGVFYALLGDEGDYQAEYRSVKFAHLVDNEGKPPTESINGKTVVRVTSLVPLMKDVDSDAAAYVAAQEQALRGDAREARASLEVLTGRGLTRNALDESRIRSIRRFTEVSGAYGPERQDEIRSLHRRNLVAAWVILVVGTFAGLLGLCFDLLAEQVRKRIRRLSDMRSQLTGSGPSDDRTVRFDTAAAQPQLQSIAALDGDAIVASMSRRIRIYRIAATLLLAGSVIAAIAAWMSVLPSPETNSAFDNVGVVNSALDFARGVGLVAPQDTAPPSLVWVLLSPFTLLIAGLLALVVFRWAVRPILVGLIVCFVGVQLQMFIPAGDPRHVAATPHFTADIRRQLEANMAGDDVKAAAFGRSKKPLGPSAAALILAQLAYVEGRADDAAKAMAWIDGLPSSDLRGRDGDALRQRMGIITEWLHARGMIGPSLDGIHNKLRIDRIRAFSVWTGIVAAFLVAAAAAVLSLSLYAGGRRSTVQSLIQQRRKA